MQSILWKYLGSNCKWILLKAKIGRRFCITIAVRCMFELASGMTKDLTSYSLRKHFLLWVLRALEIISLIVSLVILASDTWTHSSQEPCQFTCQLEPILRKLLNFKCQDMIQGDQSQETYWYTCYPSVCRCILYSAIGALGEQGLT